MVFDVSLTHDTHAIQNLQDEWIALHSRSTARGAALSWQWVNIWWKHFNHTGELWLMQIRDSDQRLIGIAPLIKVQFQPKYGFSWRQIEFIGASHHHEHLDFIVEPGYEEQVVPLFLQKLSEQRKQWDVLHLSALADTKTLDVLATSGEDWIPNLKKEMVAPYTTLPSDTEKWMSSLSRNRRWKLRRNIKQLNEEFPDNWSIVRLCEPQELDEGLDILVTLHQAKWEALDKPGAFHFGEWTTYYRELMHCFQNEGWLRLYRMDIAGKAATLLYMYHYRGRAYNQIAGLDETMTEVPLGHVLTQHSIEEAIRDGVDEYSFMWGEEPYKYSFGAQNRIQQAFDLVINSRVQFQYKAVDFLRGVKTRMKNSSQRSLDDTVPTKDAEGVE
jgi:CelD/BcsL family acetyltransferase involved in cellulose biosynthesis